MKLHELTYDMAGSDTDFESPEIEISAVEYDSRKVRDGSLFVAVQGYSVDGNTYIPNAVKQGAAAVVTDRKGVHAPVPVIHVPDSRKALAILSDRIFGSPQNTLVMTGITGTNGKTTTAYMVKSIFEANSIGCGLIGTIEHLIGGERIGSANTTPESRDIHEFLTKIVDAKQHACVMEVSSHALALSRVYGIQYRAVAFLNLTRDHLDFHKDITSYLDAKSRLFSELSGDATAVVNIDDPHADHILKVSRGGHRTTFGFNEAADVYPLSYELGPRGTSVVLATPAGEISFQLAIPGKYNISNAMAAVGIAMGCGIPADAVVKGLESMAPVKGRFEIIDEGQEYTVIVDYAHTPDALERVLLAAREITKGKLISVFGCGGDRDRGKRPEMGAISTKLADMTIITSDNPRTEDPQSIIDDIVEGITGMAEYKSFLERVDAIMASLHMAHPDDTVVIAGKGHEDYQIIGTEKKHFDDSATVRRMIKAMKWKATHCNGY